MYNNKDGLISTNTTVTNPSKSDKEGSLAT